MQQNTIYCQLQYTRKKKKRKTLISYWSASSAPSALRLGRIRPHTFIYITVNVFSCKAAGKICSAASYPALDRLYSNVTTGLFHCLQKVCPFVRPFWSYTFHRHAEKNSSMGLRNGEYAGRKIWDGHWTNCGPEQHDGNLHYPKLQHTEAARPVLALLLHAG